MSASAAVLASTVTTSTRSVTSGTVTVRVDTRISLVGKVGVVRARGVRAKVRSGVATSVRSTTSQAGASRAVVAVGAVGTSGAVLASANTTSAGGVASSAVAVGINTRINLVGKMRVVGARRVRSVSVGAVCVGASEAATSVGVAAVCQTGTLMLVSP